MKSRASNATKATRPCNAVRGEEESLAWIIERFSPYLMVHASHRMPAALKSVCDPEDVVNDVWLSVIPRISSVDAQDGSMSKSLLKYLSTAVFNRIKSLSRKLGRGEAVRFEWKSPTGSVETGADRLAIDTTGIVTRTARSEVRRNLRELLDEMNEGDREIMLLRGLEQLSNDEVADLTGHTAGNVSKRFYRGLDKLRVRIPSSLLLELG